MASETRAPLAAKRDSRAKQAKSFVNKTVPAVLKSNARARSGVEAAELTVDPPPFSPPFSPGAGKEACRMRSAGQTGRLCTRGRRTGR